MKVKDITGQHFGRLTALYRLHNTKGRTKWLCICECGNLKEITLSDLQSGRVNSCGCLHSEVLIQRNLKHGKRHTKLYAVWRSIKTRCNNTADKNYKNYGARGIKMCDEWLHDFMSFYTWAMNNGYKEGLSIDRINNNGNYEPNNCQWTTREVQSRNIRSNRNYTINGVTHCLKDWCYVYNIKYNKVFDRIHKLGWPIEEALEMKERSGIY